MSLGSVYSLYRTMQKVDQLPLDVYKRAEFVLDSRVRVQQKEQGVETGDVEHGRRENGSLFQLTGEPGSVVIQSFCSV